MKKKSKETYIFIGILIFLIIIRALLPIGIRFYLKSYLDRVSGYRGQIKDIDLFLIKAQIRVNSLSIQKSAREEYLPFLKTKKAILNLSWTDFFKGNIVAHIRISNPVIIIVEAKEKEKRQMEINEIWDKIALEIVPFKVDRMEIENGEFYFYNPDISSKPLLLIQNIHILGKNLTNSQNLVDKLFGTVSLTATAMKDAPFSPDIAVAPYRRDPTFDADFQVENLSLPTLNPLIRNYANIDFEKGIMDLFMEIQVNKGRIDGYIKPLLSNLSILNNENQEEDFTKLFWEAIVATFAEIFENQPQDRLAGRIPIEGRITDPEMGWVALLITILQNAFIQTLLPQLENRLFF